MEGGAAGRVGLRDGDTGRGTGSEAIHGVGGKGQCEGWGWGLGEVVPCPATHSVLAFICQCWTPHLKPHLPPPYVGLTFQQTESSRDPIVVDLPLPLSTKIRDFQRYARPVLTLGQGESANHECLLVTVTGKALTDVTLAQLWASIQETHKAPWGSPVTLRMFRHGYATRAHAAVLHGIAAVGPAVLQPKADAMGNSLRMWKEVYIDGRKGAIAQTATRIAAQAATLTSEREAQMHDVAVGADGPGPSRGMHRVSPWSQSQGEGSADEGEGVTELGGSQSASSPSESTCSSDWQEAEQGSDGPGGMHDHGGKSDVAGFAERQSYGGVAVSEEGGRKRKAYRVVESSPSPSTSLSGGQVHDASAAERKRPRGIPGATQGLTAYGSGLAVGSQPAVEMQNASKAGPNMSQGGRAPTKPSTGWLSFLASGNR